jgi:hypothetical protein
MEVNFLPARKSRNALPVFCYHSTLLKSGNGKPFNGFAIRIRFPCFLKLPGGAARSARNGIVINERLAVFGDVKDGHVRINVMDGHVAAGDAVVVF